MRLQEVIIGHPDSREAGPSEFVDDRFVLGIERDHPPAAAQRIERVFIGLTDSIDLQPSPLACTTSM